MQIYPSMDIHFPESKETALLDAMKARITPPWRWQPHDAFERPAKDGDFYFHRDKDGNTLPCTLCLHRKSPGHLAVVNIVPDANTPRIEVNEYVKILREFDSLVAEPATNGLGGMTSIGTHEHTPEDYFSPEAVRLLECFCLTSNPSGSHPGDQKKWFDFLLCVYNENCSVSCDTFGACLQSKQWWPVPDIPRLVREYDFAMRLLRYADH